MSPALETTNSLYTDVQRTDVIIIYKQSIDGDRFARLSTWTGRPRKPT